MLCCAVLPYAVPCCTLSVAALVLVSMVASDLYIMKELTSWCCDPQPQPPHLPLSERGCGLQCKAAGTGCFSS